MESPPRNHLVPREVPSTSPLVSTDQPSTAIPSSDPSAIYLAQSAHLPRPIQLGTLNKGLLDHEKRRRSSAAPLSAGLTFRLGAVPAQSPSLVSSYQMYSSSVEQPTPIEYDFTPGPAIHAPTQYYTQPTQFSPPLPHYLQDSHAHSIPIQGQYQFPTRPIASTPTPQPHQQAGNRIGISDALTTPLSKPDPYTTSSFYPVDPTQLDYALAPSAGYPRGYAQPGSTGPNGHGSDGANLPFTKSASLSSHSISQLYAGSAHTPNSPPQSNVIASTLVLATFTPIDSPTPFRATIPLLTSAHSPTSALPEDPTVLSTSLDPTTILHNSNALVVSPETISPRQAASSSPLVLLAGGPELADMAQSAPIYELESGHISYGVMEQAKGGMEDIRTEVEEIELEDGMDKRRWGNQNRHVSDCSMSSLASCLTVKAQQSDQALTVSAAGLGEIERDDVPEEYRYRAGDGLRAMRDLEEDLSRQVGAGVDGWAEMTRKWFLPSARVELVLTSELEEIKWFDFSAIMLAPFFWTLQNHGLTSQSLRTAEIHETYIGPTSPESDLAGCGVNPAHPGILLEADNFRWRFGYEGGRVIEWEGTVSVIWAVMGGADECSVLKVDRLEIVIHEWIDVGSVDSRGGKGWKWGIPDAGFEMLEMAEAAERFSPVRALAENGVRGYDDALDRILSTYDSDELLWTGDTDSSDDDEEEGMGQAEWEDRERSLGRVFGNPNGEIGNLSMMVDAGDGGDRDEKQREYEGADGILKVIRGPGGAGGIRSSDGSEEADDQFA